MLQDRKRQNRKRNTTGSVPQKNEQPYTTVPRPHYVVTKPSHVCLAHPLRCCQVQKKHRQTKTSTTGSAPQDARKQTTMYPWPSLRRDKLPYVCLARPLRCCKKKKQKKQQKHTGSSLHEKQNNHVPPALTTSRQTLLCLPGAPA